jgi:S-adenosyl-L-methionine hydrolase (adenosine-forming)
MERAGGSHALLITLTTDFEAQSQGVGMMEAVIAQIAPHARVVHYRHGIPPFDITTTARVLETVQFIEPACHVCVCDPGVGTQRRALALRASRGDIFIGPDNGALLCAVKMLGGLIEAREIISLTVLREPVSPVFHGRDVFAPAAAHLATGLPFESLGPQLDPDGLVAPPYSEAVHSDGRLHSQVILIDKFGNTHLNITAHAWAALKLADGTPIELTLREGNPITAEQRRTFGAVRPNVVVLVPDNDGRTALSKNRGSFAGTYGARVGDDVVIHISAASR